MHTLCNLRSCVKRCNISAVQIVTLAACIKRDGEESARLHQLVKLETSSDWPTSIQPNTMLTLHSQQMDSCSLNSLNLTDLSAVPSGQTQRLPWLLNLVQLASSQSTSASKQPVPQS